MASGKRRHRSLSHGSGDDGRHDNVVLPDPTSGNADGGVSGSVRGLGVKGVAACKASSTMARHAN